MEFMEYDFADDADIPSPQPVLNLPIANIETFSKKMPNFNNLKSLLNFEERTASQEEDTSTPDQKSSQYAQVSMKLVEKNHHVAAEGNARDSTYLSTKLSKVLNNSVNEELVKELFSLSLNQEDLIDSSLVGSMSRRNLRSQVESNIIKNQASVLKEYAPTIKQFKAIGTRIDKLNALTSINQEKMGEIVKDLASFDEEFKTLNSAKMEVRLKKNLLSNFKKKFTLNEFEEYLIVNNTEVNDDFFRAIMKLDSINENSSILFSTENSNLGVNMLKKTSKLVEKSNHILAQNIRRLLIHPVWTNSVARLRTFHKCLRLLKIRSELLFEEVLEGFVNDRSKLLNEDFNSQVASLNAHDPVRFIGDLLAYVHSMVINEIELMNSLFKISPEELVGQDHDTDKLLVEASQNLEELSELVDSLLNKIFDRLSKLIRSKIEQLIAIEVKTKVVFQIFNLFDLYTMMFGKLLSPDTSLIRTINELLLFSRSRLRDLIESRLKSIRTSNAAQLDLNDDLQPPEWIIDFYSEVLPLIDQSKIHFDSIFKYDDQEAQKFLDLIVDDPIAIFNDHINKKHFSEFEKTILELNFTDLISSKIVPISLLHSKEAVLNQQTGTLKARVIKLQYEEMLERCHLTDLQNIVNMILPFDDSFFDVSVYQPITENKMFTTSEIAKVNEAVAEYLPNSLVDVQGKLMKLNSPMILNDIVESFLLDFVKFYYKFNIVVAEYLGEKLIWSDVEVATVLGIEDWWAQVKPLLSMD